MIENQINNLSKNIKNLETNLGQSVNNLSYNLTQSVNNLSNNLESNLNNLQENDNYLQREIDNKVNNERFNRDNILEILNIKKIKSKWQQIGQDIDGEAQGDRSGRSVSLSSDGTILAVGALGNQNFTGHVRVYKYSENVWQQIGQDIDGEAASDFSGYSLSLSSDGTILAVGASVNDGNGYSSGHVRVYKYSENVWQQIGQDIDEAEYDFSGWSVSLSSDGTILAIGAVFNNGQDSGHARVYKYSGKCLATNRYCGYRWRSRR